MDFPFTQNDNKIKTNINPFDIIIFTAITTGKSKINFISITPQQYYLLPDYKLYSKCKDNTIRQFES